jgi:hypothetical protein
MRSLLAGLVMIAGANTSGAVRGPSPAPGRSAPSADPAPQAPEPQQGICCCRLLRSQRWQYSWMEPERCQQASGSCVAPDHC